MRRVVHDNKPAQLEEDFPGFPHLPAAPSSPAPPRSSSHTFPPQRESRKVRVDGSVMSPTCEGLGFVQEQHVSGSKEEPLSFFFSSSFLPRCFNLSKVKEKSSSLCCGLPPAASGLLSLSLCVYVCVCVWQLQLLHNLSGWSWGPAEGRLRGPARRHSTHTQIHRSNMTKQSLYNV